MYIISKTRSVVTPAHAAW